jgi:phytanoyl-CoA hydroxylase
VLRFLSLVYERPPVVFQTMSMRKGSEEPLHIDTGPLSLTEPLTLAASWLALQDVVPRSGEFMYVPGSQRVPEVLNAGTGKAHHGDTIAYGKVLARISELCKERGLVTEHFTAKKGDVLIWAADLMHGGAPIEDHAVTRKSLVAHFMPLGVMPTFYDFATVSALRYPSGGYCLDRLVPKPATEATVAPTAPELTPPPVPVKARRGDRAIGWVKERLRARSSER